MYQQDYIVVGVFLLLCPVVFFKGIVTRASFYCLFEVNAVYVVYIGLITGQRCEWMGQWVL